MEELGQPVTEPEEATGPERATETVEAAGPERAAGPEPATPREPVLDGRRPMLERLGMAAVAIVIAGLFGIVAFAAWTGGEAFLAVMAAIGALMTIWAALAALVRG